MPSIFDIFSRNKLYFIDSEVSVNDGSVVDLAAIRDKDAEYVHTASQNEFAKFVSGATYICGHNIIRHDINYVRNLLPDKSEYIDTLFLSPLLFPQKPYHKLVKDDKLLSDALNNPYNDCIKARELFYDEVSAFKKLPEEIQTIYYALLSQKEGYKGFFSYLNIDRTSQDLPKLIKEFFKGRICEKADLESLIRKHPEALSYALAIIFVDDLDSITPAWVVMTFPEVQTVIHALRNNPCDNCEYCKTRIDPVEALQRYFGYPAFRSYDGEPLQEKAARSAVRGESLLAIFPTGGGKSVTFQVPALMAGELEHGLTIVISPLQSLMKDQVDNLVKKGIARAVTINGAIDPVERADAFEKVESGFANLLYISPESLRSRSIERIMLSRNVVRFVIDEAHCFSSWGQDFRVDYLFIGDFIKKLGEKKRLKAPIPVSCFTATAKQKVISDIRDYFREKLGIELNLFATSSARENLHYKVIHQDTDEDKYATLRALIENHNCPTIVYSSRTKTTEKLAERLQKDGYKAKAYHGQMDRLVKTENQDSFMRGETQIIAATSAFGMGVDKSNVGLVVHYEISDSLENYVQEAGRAGRDPSIDADCYVLYNENDLDKHFIMLNRSRLSMNEIQQIWRAVKTLSASRGYFRKSALEIARAAGWDSETVDDIETRVKTALAALEQTGYIKREMNSPRVYADSIVSPSVAEAVKLIDSSSAFEDEDKRLKAHMIISSLVSKRAISKAGEADAESRVDYLSDRLGIPLSETVDIITRLRQEGILSDDTDMSASYENSIGIIRKLGVIKRCEDHLLGYFNSDSVEINLKQINADAADKNLNGCSISILQTIVNYYVGKQYISATGSFSQGRLHIVMNRPLDAFKAECTRRQLVDETIARYLTRKKFEKKEKLCFVQYSVKELADTCSEELDTNIDHRGIQNSLLWLSTNNIISVEGGFLVVYSRLEIHRLELDNRIQYKKEDYAKLDEYYKMKTQQIHIVGEYANMMVKSYDDAQMFVSEYFGLEYSSFIKKYFQGNREGEINRNITASKYEELFGSLSEKQREIIDDLSRYIVVAAGPGSGKTRVLVHKLAALLLMDDIKSEQLLMLTFSRAAATEFRQRLVALIGTVAKYVDIKTFHSYCFDILGRPGTLGESDNIVKMAVDALASGEVESSRVTKTVLVIDEAQDMSADEYRLIELLKEHNSGMKIIAVGDDDQNIYSWRGSDSKHFMSLYENEDAKKYELIENYRSLPAIVDIANKYAALITERFKEEPIVPVRKGKGIVSLTKYKYPCEYHILETIKSRNDRSVAVLTDTNNEAAMYLEMLNSNGIKAKLIQEAENCRVYDLVEIRVFMNKLREMNSDSPTIDAENWKTAMDEMIEYNNGSTQLDDCIRFLEGFRSMYSRIYVSDLEEYLYESELSDMFEVEDDVVTVSTIHRSKGREFGTVYLATKGKFEQSDAERRKIYVGMTRAKDNLFICTMGNSFDEFAPMCDDEQRESYNRMVILLGMRDIFLDTAMQYKKLIFKLKAGQEIFLENYDYCMICNGKKYRVCTLSKRGKAKISSEISKGYRIEKTVVRALVAWNSQGDETEYPQILTYVYMRRGQ
ncbi:MAG: RecQ family ATP-dependent DNA helicase [Oscillospiraceae bacterium]|nr:RecQ family ATP-dependent DNA helicase [Oscillospiraceae bacterium]